MANVLLVDFPDSFAEPFRQVDPTLEFTFHKTLWNSNLLSGGALLPENINANILVISGNYLDRQSIGLHGKDYRKVSKVLADGGAVVVFVGDCELFHLKNLVGVPDRMELGAGLNPSTSVWAVTEGAVSLIFSSFANEITQARSLFPFGLGSSAESLIRGNGVEFVAIHQQSGFPVSVICKVGNGIQLFLPKFREMQVILQALLCHVLPAIKPDLFEAKTDDWLDAEAYLFPAVRTIRNKLKAEKAHHEEVVRGINEHLSATIEHEQAPYNKLLTSSGDELKLAVKHCLELFGFVVVDVDEYWKEKDASRQKEEDLWLFQPGCKPAPAESPFILAEVKSARRGGASDDDCSTVTRYVLRRVREFPNHDIRGLLVINHFCAFPAHARKRAFSEKQNSDAGHARNILMTTYDLFRLAKALKENRKTTEEVKTAILSTQGTFVLPNDIESL